MRHRRFLPRYHPYRKLRAAFDNTIEEELAPIPLSGDEVLTRVQGLNRPFGKNCLPPSFKGIEDVNRPCFKKKSIWEQVTVPKLPLKIQIVLI